MEAGNDLAELRPINPDPSARIRGNHKGPAYALNVVDPVPGMHYIYVRRDEGDIQRKENEGFELERRENAQGARMGRETDPQWGRNMDGTIGRRDIVRMRIPDEGYAAYMERKQANVRAQSAEHVVNEFIEKGEHLNERFGGGGPLHYRAKQHRDQRVAGVSSEEE